MTHKDLEVYRETMTFIVSVYRITDTLPDSERFGLSSQMRSAAVSIASNIAEGAAHSSTKEFIRFLYHSLGSAAELETQLEVAIQLGFSQRNEVPIDQLTKIRKMLIGLINSLKKKL